MCRRIGSALGVLARSRRGVGLGHFDLQIALRARA